MSAHATMSLREIRRANRKSMERHRAAENAKLSDQFVVVPEHQWPPGFESLINKPYSVLINRDYLVQCFSEPGAIRLTINRTTICSDGDWRDGITWDDLQEIKRKTGFGDRFAVEIYPRDKDVINVANMRHLWVLTEPLSIGWTKP